MAVRTSLVRFAVVAALAGCRAGDGGPRALLDRISEDYQAVVAVDIAQIRTTWLGGAARLIGSELPPCVLERAWGARHAVVAWDDTGDWVMGLSGPGVTAAGCDQLDRRRGDQAWIGPGQLRRGSDDGFFAAADRRRRLRSVASAPVHAVGDLDLSPGITARVAARLDPRDGIAGRVVARFADRDAVSGALQMMTRWRGELDRDRLGGAWPVIEAIDSAIDRSDRSRATLVVECRLAGERGAVASALAVAAVVDGWASPPVQCRDVTGTWAGRVRCAPGGWIEVDATVRDEVLDDPLSFASGARVVPSLRNGQQQGFKLIAIRPDSLVAALGLRNGDVVTAVAGIDLATVDSALEAYVAIRDADTLEVTVLRGGRTATLRYRFH